jgi:hypothetical protein
MPMRGPNRSGCHSDLEPLSAQFFDRLYATFVTMRVPEKL